MLAREWQEEEFYIEQDRGARSGTETKSGGASAYQFASAQSGGDFGTRFDRRLISDHDAQRTERDPGL